MSNGIDLTITLPNWGNNTSEISLSANGYYGDVAELTIEQRVQRLEDIRAIENLKFAYWDAFDSKNVERIANEVFAPDIHFEFPDFGAVTDGAMPTAVQAAGGLADNNHRTCHQGCQNYIQVTSETTARGVWALRDNLINLNVQSEFQGRGYYDEEYVKIDGRWYIAKMSLRYNMADGRYLKRFAAETNMPLAMSFE